jgi:subtilisin family serine protease
MRGRWILFPVILLILAIYVSAEIDSKVIQSLAPDSEVHVIVTLKDAPRLRNSANFRSEALTELRSKSGFAIQHNLNKNSVSGRITKKRLQNLLADPNLKDVRLAGKMRLALDVSGPAVQSTLTNGLVYNGINLTGQGISVCVIDTGIDYTHPNLGGCTSESFLNGSCAKVPAGYDYVNLDSDPIDDQGHGTHVSGIVASDDGQYRGVAPSASIIAMKVLDSSGEGYTDDIAAAIYDCTDNALEYNISVITMSLGDEGVYTGYCDDTYPEVTDAINYAVAHGIIVTVCSGNTGSIVGMSNPACITNATSVGAVTDADSFVYNRNALTDLISPGVGIISTKRTGGFTSMSGTSMAVPHVAGAAAIIYQYGKLFGQSYTASIVENILKSTGKVLNDSLGSMLNYYKLQLYDAVLSLDTSAPSISLDGLASVVFDDYVNITVTSNEVLSSLLLDFNGVNETLTGGNMIWYANKTNLSGHYTVRACGNDSADNWGCSETKIVFADDTPTIGWYTPLDNESVVAENYSLLFNHSSSDINGDNLSYGWKLDGASVSSSDSYLYSPDFYAAGEHNLTLYISDGYLSVSHYWNVTVTNTNYPPIIISASDLEVIETEMAQADINATDIDGDILLYYYSAPLNESGQWVPIMNQSGEYNVSVIVSDGQANSTASFTITVLDAPDYDGDMIKDSIDTDDDNDGILDVNDFVLGNVSNLITLLDDVQISINGSLLSAEVNGLGLVNISNGSIFVSFNYMFNSSNVLDFSEVILNSTRISNQHYVAIRGITLSGNEKKTISLKNYSVVSNSICVKDAEINSFDEFTSRCNGADEVVVRCPGSAGGYSCTYAGGIYTISGLNHSGVREFCAESWSCDSWSTCSGSTQSRTCTETSGCGTTFDEPDTSQSCTVSTSTGGSSGGSSSGGGGGGGGGGGSSSSSSSVASQSTTKTESVKKQTVTTDEEIDTEASPLSASAVSGTDGAPNRAIDRFKYAAVIVSIIFMTFAVTFLKKK